MRDHRIASDYTFYANQPMNSKYFLQNLRRGITLRIITKQHYSVSLLLMFVSHSPQTMCIYISPPYLLTSNHLYLSIIVRCSFRPTSQLQRCTSIGLVANCPKSSNHLVKCTARATLVCNRAPMLTRTTSGTRVSDAGHQIPTAESNLDPNVHGKTSKNPPKFWINSLETKTQNSFASEDTERTGRTSP